MEQSTYKLAITTSWTLSSQKSSASKTALASTAKASLLYLLSVTAVCSAVPTLMFRAFKPAPASAIILLNSPIRPSHYTNLLHIKV